MRAIPMPLPARLEKLSARYLRTQKCTRSPWLWVGPALFCAAAAAAVGLARQPDHLMPPLSCRVCLEPESGPAADRPALAMAAPAPAPEAKVAPAGPAYLFTVVYDGQFSPARGVLADRRLTASLALGGHQLFSVPRGRAAAVPGLAEAARTPGSKVVVQDAAGRPVGTHRVASPRDVRDAVAKHLAPGV